MAGFSAARRHTQFARAAFFALRAHAARNSNSHSGLFRGIRRARHEGPQLNLGQKCLTFGSELNDVVFLFPEVIIAERVKGS